MESKTRGKQNTVHVHAYAHTRVFTGAECLPSVGGARQNLHPGSRCRHLPHLLDVVDELEQGGERGHAVLVGGKGPVPEHLVALLVQAELPVRDPLVVIQAAGDPAQTMKGHSPHADTRGSH